MRWSFSLYTLQQGLQHARYAQAQLKRAPTARRNMHAHDINFFHSRYHAWCRPTRRPAQRKWSPHPPLWWPFEPVPSSGPAAIIKLSSIHACLQSASTTCKLNGRRSTHCRHRTNHLCFTLAVTGQTWPKPWYRKQRCVLFHAVPTQNDANKAFLCRLYVSRNPNGPNPKWQLNIGGLCESLLGFSAHTTQAARLSSHFGVTPLPPSSLTPERSHGHCLTVLPPRPPYASSTSTPPPRPPPLSRILQCIAERTDDNVNYINPPSTPPPIRLLRLCLRPLFHPTFTSSSLHMAKNLTKVLKPKKGSYPSQSQTPPQTPIDRPNSPSKCL